ncbi:MAG TPA: SUKH-4 family immunity protein [Verrucomicrobiae bacterium]
MNESLDNLAAAVRAAYRADELRRLDRETVLRAGIEPLDAEFLCTVGVPIVEELEISFNLAGQLPTLQDYLKGKPLSSYAWPGHLVCLNEKDDWFFAIDRERDGCVISFELGDDAEAFINSKLRYMVVFLAECRLHWMRYQDKDTPKGESFRIAEEWMRKVDERGFNGGWWQAVLEDMKTYG